MMKSSWWVIVLLFSMAQPVFAMADGQEGKGGSPLKDRFRRVGHFLVYHLENQQERLAKRIHDFPRFKKTVAAVDLQIVEKFPANIQAAIAEELVGLTVDDASKPGGKSILLQAKRFTDALTAFDAGREVILTVAGDPRATVKEQSLAHNLIQTSFLSFCFHEYLNASGEDDSGLQISSLLSSDREELQKWNQSHGPLIDNKIWVALPPCLGKAVKVMDREPSIEENDEALRNYLDEREKNCQLQNAEAVEAVSLAFGAKLPLLSAKVSEAAPESVGISFVSPWIPPRAGIFFRTSGWVRLNFDSERKVIEQKLDTVVGEGGAYSEFITDPERPLMDRDALLVSHAQAVEAYRAQWQKKLSEWTSLYRRLYGDRFLFLSPGAMREDYQGIGNSVRYGSGAYEHAADPMSKRQVKSDPVLYILEE